MICRHLFWMGLPCLILWLHSLYILYMEQDEGQLLIVKLGISIVHNHDDVSQ